MKRKGSVMIIVAMSIILIMGIVAIVIDYGVFLVEKNNLQYGMDAAVLAGIKELPDSEQAARTMVNDYLVLNDVDPANVTILIDNEEGIIRLNGEITVQTIFARVFGVTEVNIAQTSAAQVGVAGSAATGLRPFVVKEDQCFPGNIVVLREMVGDQGNYGPVRLGDADSGLSDLVDNVLYGTDVVINVGDFLDTEPGAMTSLYRQASDYINSLGPDDDDRYWVLPVIGSDVDYQGLTSVEVKGFALIKVSDLVKTGNDWTIEGEFVAKVIAGNINNEAGDYGLLSSRLIK
ncbi:MULTISPECIES: TadE/TadG family type IV pilus assembly protein [unclassified Fusibacter]|uniref:TadE/TadG family type IV pilus assembly protein n=1 Tax=unclassified Fusibacter TaxID=2624464 RepID=UPI0010127F00|nr:MULTISPECIES: pilus assembly protein TadG-related protein [unclassified Fusibacter]MCK8059963.1 pilus assembly protein TadG-related protein [Fusibacter sp. A2]NPE22105.1 hypothetical protein [Fusibacter sp. A1]RXV60884.1 hypothetical protein DWB64_09680 [Fusibacter sp. A1]